MASHMGKLSRLNGSDELILYGSGILSMNKNNESKNNLPYIH